MHPPAVTPETHLPSNMDVLHLHGCSPSRKEGHVQHMSKSVKNEQKSLKGILLILKIMNKHINIDSPVYPFISKRLRNTSDMTVLLLNVKLMEPSFSRLLCLLLTYKVPGGTNSMVPSFIIPLRSQSAVLFVVLRLSKKNGQLSPSLLRLKPSSLRRLIVTLLLFSYT